MQRCRDDYICGLTAYESSDAEFCILHSPDPKKDKDMFRIALAAHVKTRGGRFTRFVFPLTVGAADFDTDSDLDFIGAVFLADFAFWRTTIRGQVNFGSASFCGEARFTSTQFKESVNFSQARFAGSFASFVETAFLSDVTFNGTTFTRNATFDAVQFGSSASFNDAHFVQNAYFWNSQFAGPADFRWASFGPRVSFSEVHFKSSAAFAPRPPRDTQPQSPIFAGTELEFTHVLMDQPHLVVFRDADLRQALFDDTDVRTIEFSGVEWPTVRGRQCIFDEIRSPKNDERRPSLDALERLYRQLKQNYEDRRDYERAGDFHFSEKEMRRCNTRNPAGLRLLLTVYRFSSGYGERYARPLLCVAALAFVITSAEVVLGAAGSTGHILSIARIDAFLKLMHYNIRTMLLLKPQNMPRSDFELADTIESVAGPVLIGLFALALRQRLRR